MKKETFILFSLFGFISIGYGQVHTILSGQIKNLKKDTIKIVLEVNTITRQSETIFVPAINGKFKQELKLSKSTYLYITDGVNYVNGLMEPGDQSTILYDADNAKSTLEFSGKGGEKFAFLNSLIQFKLYDKLKEQIPIAKEQKSPFDHMFKFIDSMGSIFSSRLNSIRLLMKPESFKLLNADIKATIMGNRYRSVGLLYHESIDETLNKRQKELTTESKRTLQNILKFDNSLSYSSTYSNEVYNIMFRDYDGLFVSNKISTGIIKKYDYLNSKLPINLKIPVFTLFLEYDITKLNQSEDIETVIQRTYKLPKDSVYKNYILKRYEEATSFKKGTDAPAFVLENIQGEKVSLSSFKGKVIYLDFWYGACGPCHSLFEILKPVKKYYVRNENVIFLCVSIDSKEIWKTALKKFNVEGYQVFTENKESKHPIIKAYKVAGYPTTCLIDKNGKIFMANPSNNPDELQRQIEDALMLKSN